MKAQYALDPSQQVPPDQRLRRHLDEILKGEIKRLEDDAEQRAFAPELERLAATEEEFREAYGAAWGSAKFSSYERYEEVLYEDVVSEALESFGNPFFAVWAERDPDAVAIHAVEKGNADAFAAAA